MKYFFLIAFFFSYGLVQSQDYLPVLVEDHIWNIKNISCPDPCHVSYEEFIVGEESTINGVVYQELLKGSGTFYLREDNGKIYQYFQSTDEEFLILDFNLEVGDTYTFPPPYQTDIVDMYLTEITMEEIAGELRKVLYFDFCEGCGSILEFWIEGIGSSNALFPGGNNFIDSGSDLACFTASGVTYFFNNNTKCFEIIGIENNPLPVSVLSPNPVSHISILQFTSEMRVQKVKVFDVNGKLVKELSVTSDAVLIHATEYPAGIYFYKVYSEEKLIQAEKFIVR